MDSVFERARERLKSASRLVVVAHSDLDGIASAAVLRGWFLGLGGLRSVEVHVTGVRGLYRSLRRLAREAASRPDTVIAVLDMAPSSRSEAVAIASFFRGGRVGLVWIDHHEWVEGAREELERVDGVVVVDKSVPTSTLVCRVVGCGEGGQLAAIARLGALDDACVGDELVSRWRIVLRYMDFNQMVRAIEELSRGNLWPQWVEDYYNSVVEEYRNMLRQAAKSKHVFTFNGIRIAVVIPPPRISACDLELAGIAKPEDVDIVVIVYPKGISIRTRETLDAACIARKLGGGGHARAAGAPRTFPSMGAGQIARQIAALASECTGGSKV
ncbi:MAG TPA: hypothetical protein EYH08_03665 [Pyrodictium sp.]|nr:hypothetical protein [Pyrodictium sp.]